MNSKNDHEGKSPEKKPYQTPSMQVYGSIRAMTNNTAKVSANGDGGKGNTKTA